MDVDLLLSKGLINWKPIAPLTGVIHSDLFPVGARQMTSMDWTSTIERSLEDLFPGSKYIVASDGSVLGSTAGFAVWSSEFQISLRASDFTTPFQAEAYGLAAGLNKIIDMEIAEEAIFFLTDCQSLLRWLESGSDDVERAWFWTRLSRLADRKVVKLVWVPGHVGYPPNERADQLAKGSLDLPFEESTLPDIAFLPKFLCPTLERKEDSSGRSNLLGALSPTYASLEFRVPRPHLQPFRRGLVEWLWVRLRVNRPVFRVRGSQFASPEGWCLSCPEVDFSPEHFLLSCPRFNREREALRRDLCLTLNVPQVTLNMILSCGSSVTPLKNTILKVGEVISTFLCAALSSSRVPVLS